MENNFSPAQLARRDTERLNGYRQLLDFYHGQQWDSRERRGEKHLTFNYARVFIEKIASYLMSGVTFTVDPVEDTDEAQVKAQSAEAALHRVYEENNLEQLDLETEIDCAILGDAAYKVTWNTETKSIRVTAPDVQGIYAWWAADDMSQIWRIASKYSLSGEMAETMYMVKPQGRTAMVVEVWTDREFELWVDGIRVDRRPNPYGFIPFVIYPNLREPKKFWGLSDLVQVKGTQQELNRALSQLSRILELSGNPIAVLENIEESDDIAVSPGAVWNVPESAKAYLLDLLQGGGVRLHIDYINLLYRILHDLSESPRAAFGGTERDLSGIALEIELQPLLQKVRRKRLVRTAVYNKRNRMILKLLEKFRDVDFGDNHLRVVWGPVVPTDMTRLVSNEQILVQNGIHSRRSAMDEIGVKNPETEFKQWLEERETILRMNKEPGTKPARGGGRERELPPEALS
jgi:hypothetical protein